MDKNARRQAAHFDEHTPISPWPDILRGAGFRYHYIAKDLVIKRALDRAAVRQGMRVPDIGCGTGVWLDRLGSTYGTEGIGIDISANSLAAANAQKVRNNSFVLAEARALPFAEGAFDLVTNLGVLEHIEYPEKVLIESIRVARNSGHMLIFAVSNQNRFTFQWFERRFLSMLRIDLHPLPCHLPELLIDPQLMHDRLNSEAASLEALQFFHAFFSSLFDRFLLVLYLIFKKTGVFAKGNSLRQIFGVAFLSVATVMSRHSLRALLWMDNPWFKRGYANGFLAVARKTDG